MKWISVDEMLPKGKYKAYNYMLSDDVLGYVRHNGMDCYYISRCFHYFDGETFMKHHVTHWMPLPELPEL